MPSNAPSVSKIRIRLATARSTVYDAGSPTSCVHMNNTNNTELSVPRPTLDLKDAVALVVGIVIGAGIFRLPALVAGNTGTAETMMIAWILGAVISFMGALCYAELASAHPNAGGEYHFLERAYGSDVSRLFAWARMTVIAPGSIAQGCGRPLPALHAKEPAICGLFGRWAACQLASAEWW